MDNRIVLGVKNLKKSFNNNIVVKGINFSVRRGDIYGFLGPNGAGKTTTIRMILGLVHKTEGTVILNGYNVDENFNKAIDGVGAVVETPRFYLNMTAVQNLKLFANLHSNITEEKIHEILKTVGLLESKNKKVKTFSLGMKQRLGIGMALLNDPKIVFLDEPTNGIDPQGVIEVREMITTLARERGITFFITTHILHEVEQICNKVAILRNGEIIKEGLVEELLNTDVDDVEIKTGEKEAITPILREISFISKVEQKEDGIRIKIEKGKSGLVNKMLNEKGFTIDFIVPIRQSLEKLFIDLTKESEHDVI